MAHHVSKAKFAELVERALSELPPQFASALEEMRLEIRDRPTHKELKSVGLDENNLLLGLYSGVALPDRSVEHSGRMPDVIYIFQEDCELACDSEEELVREVRITVLHEIGHHFGLDEDDLESLGYG
jgi:predicted Zn-dependent protease with MMP-like domain